MKVYPESELKREMAFLAYYLNWSRAELLQMDHLERRSWCDQVSEINRSQGEDTPGEVSITELR